MGVVVFAASGTVGMAALAGSATAAAASGAAVAGMFVVGPALVLGGAMRGLNNQEVAREIEARQTLLPAVLPAGDGRNLDLFFPLAPSPEAVTFTYVMDAEVGSSREIRLIPSRAPCGRNTKCGPQFCCGPPEQWRGQDLALCRWCSILLPKGRT